MAIEDWNIDKFDVSKQKFSGGSSLQAFDNQVIQMRAQFLIELSIAFQKTFEFVDLSCCHQENTLSNKHFCLKESVVPLIIEKYVDGHIRKVDLGPGEVNVSINRRKAYEFAESKRVDNSCKFTIFGQVIDQVAGRYPSMKFFA